MNRPSTVRHLPRYALLGLVLLVAACSARPYKVETVRKETHLYAGYLDYAAKDKQPGFSHPQEIAVEQLKTALSALVFKEEKTLRSDKPRKVFLDPEIIQLAPALQELLAKVNSSQAVYFALERAKGEGVGLFSRITSGQLFWRGERLHVVFGEIQQEDVEGNGLHPKRLNLGHPEKSYRKNWQLMENRAVAFAEVSGKPGKKHSSQVKIDFAQLGPQAETAAQTPVQPAPTAEAETLEQRLSRLKGMYEKGLIDEAEYKKKKAELLGDL